MMDFGMVLLSVIATLLLGDLVIWINGRRKR
jgi:hypothetical protein